MILFPEDSQDVTVEAYAVSDLTGLPATGLAFSNVSVYYVRNRSASVSVPLFSLAAPGAVHLDGGFVEIDAANAPGWYRLDLPDAAWVAGAVTVTVVLGAGGVLFAPVRAQIGAVAPAALASEVHFCKAALVNKRVHTISTGVDVIKDNDGVSTLVTMTPQDGGDDIIEVVPS